MKRKRGRPKGKKYPQPRNIYEGFWIASFGKLGASPAMLVILVCPYRDLEEIQTIPPRKRTRQNRKILKPESDYIEQWNREIGTVIAQRIVTRDHDFFRQIADLLAELSKEDYMPLDKDRRHLALDYKLWCHISGQPFNLKGLRDVYVRQGVKIDPSTLSKLYRWAESAPWRKVPRTLAPLFLNSKRARNSILKP
jgi:hypothetical protein